MAIYPQRLTIYLYSAHRAVIFAIAQLSCYIRYCPFYTHLKIDKINAGHHKNLDGKQNYQEPGVEAELNFEFFEFTIMF